MCIRDRATSIYRSKQLNLQKHPGQVQAQPRFHRHPKIRRMALPIVRIGISTGERAEASRREPGERVCARLAQREKCRD
eukprot:14941478-Alexandrium_andersonii.AAC.1